jgi:hypothetical protein
MTAERIIMRAIPLNFAQLGSEILGTVDFRHCRML